MPKKIMTLGVTTKHFTLRGKSTTLIADFRDIPFQCQFVDGAINGPPKIRISVQEIGKGIPDEIRVEVIPPGRTGFDIRGNDVAHRAFMPVSRRPRRLTNEPPSNELSLINEPSSNEITTLFSINTGFNPLLHGFDSPVFGEGTSVLDDFNPTPPNPVPPGGGGLSKKVVIHPLNPETDPQGRWKIRIHNRSQDAANFFVVVEHPETVQALETTRVPFQLLNRTFSEALFLMSPRIRINNGTALIRFNKEFLRLAGISDIRKSVPKELININLERIGIKAECDQETGYPNVVMELVLEEEGDEIELPGPNVDIHNMSMQVGFVFHLDEPLSSDFFNTALKRTNGSSLQRRHLHIRPFLATNPSITSMWITGAKILAAAILGIGGPGKVDEKVSEWIESAVDKIGQAYGVAFEEGISDYIRDYLLQLVEKDHAIHTLTCDADNIIVEHHALPDAQPKIIPQPVEPNPIEAREKLREGEIDHIVFLMMENRSFDHMLGYRSLKGKVVNGLTGNETNSIPENNPPYTVHHLTQTRGIPIPPHDHDRGGGH